MKLNASPKATVMHCFFATLALLLAACTFSSCTKEKNDQDTTVTVQTIDTVAQMPIDTVQVNPVDTTAKNEQVDPEIQDLKGQEDPALEGEKKYVIVTGSNVRLRTTPEINDNNILKDNAGKPIYPKKGERLQFYREEGDFCFVDYHDKLVYIAKKFTTPEKK